MGHYKNLFDEDYMEAWSHKTNERNVPVEKRVKCDCDAEDEAYFLSCNECEKKWCMYCGDQKDPPFGTPYFSFRGEARPALSRAFHLPFGWHEIGYEWE